MSNMSRGPKCKSHPRIHHTNNKQKNKTEKWSVLCSCAISSYAINIYLDCSIKPTALSDITVLNPACFCVFALLLARHHSDSMVYCIVDPPAGVRNSAASRFRCLSASGPSPLLTDGFDEGPAGRCFLFQSFKQQTAACGGDGQRGNQWHVNFQALQTTHPPSLFPSLLNWRFCWRFSRIRGLEE